MTWISGVPERIVVLSHERDDLRGGRYMLQLLVDAWRAGGSEVIELKGAGRFVPADVAILHVNLTIIPDEYLRLAEHYPLVLNGRVRDISKRRISLQPVRRDDAYAGPVIVKTDRNFGGFPEARLLGHRHDLRRGLSKLLPWSWTGRLHPYAYPVYPSKAQVPGRVWRNDALVVERFAAERERGFYCLRTWVFCGDREFGSRAIAASPRVKSGTSLRREFINGVPDDLRAVRARLGFDFGKFDYGIVDGKTVLYDVNRTPTFSRRRSNGALRERMDELASGLRHFAPAATERPHLKEERAQLCPSP